MSDGTVLGDTGKRREREDVRATLQCSERRLASSATFCLTLWSKVAEVTEQANREGPVMGIIAYADDFVVSSEFGKADCVWDETTGALGEIGLEIEQSKSCYTSKHKASWSHKTPAFKKEIVVLGTEATEWNSMANDE